MGLVETGSRLRKGARGGVEGQAAFPYPSRGQRLGTGGRGCAELRVQSKAQTHCKGLGRLQAAEAWPCTALPHSLGLPEEVVLAHDGDEEADEAFDCHGNEPSCHDVPFEG